MAGPSDGTMNRLLKRWSEQFPKGPCGSSLWRVADETRCEDVEIRS